MKNSQNPSKGDVHLSFNRSDHGLNRVSGLDLLVKADRLMQDGDFARAKKIYLKILNLGEKSHHLYNNLGVIFGMEGRSEKAIYCLRKAVKINSNRCDSYNNLGNCLQQVGRLREAIVCFQKSLKIDPSQCSAYSNCGICYQEIGEPQKAIVFYKKALSINPRTPEVYNNLGISLRDLGDFPSALKAYLSAVRIRKDYPEVCNNIGNLMQDNGNLGKAMRSYEKAISLRPSYAEAQNNLAMLELLHGNYFEGLNRYEYRLKCKSSIEFFKHMQGRLQWTGNLSSLPEKKLLVCAEQGLGDSIQFSRYILSLQQMGVNVIFVAPRKLHSLLEESGISAKCVTHEEARNYSDEPWIPLLSIPRLLQVTPNNPLIQNQYLEPHSFWVEKWKKILAPMRGRLVGINWEGNRSDNKKNDRNFSPARLVEFINEAGLVAFSLQRGGVDEFKNLFKHDDDEFNLVQEQMHALANSDSPEHFAEFSAMVKNLDLVITSATTTSHLSGAMGVKTWTLVPKTPDWRWGLDGAESFWYKSMKIFRQSERKIWDKTVEDICQALRQEFMV